MHIFVYAKISPGTIGSIYEWQRFVAHSYASENNIWYTADIYPLMRIIGGLHGILASVDLFLYYTGKNNEPKATLLF